VGKPGEQASAVPAPAAAPAASEPEVNVAAIKRRLGKDGDADGGEVRVSGRARRIAEERGVDLRGVTGTGPGGRITEKDVLAHAGGSGAAPAAQAAAAPRSAAVRGETVALSKMRAVVGRRMQQSKQTVPHFYVTLSIDMTNALALRDELQRGAGEGDAKVSVNDMIVKAAALALAEMPEVNARLEDDRIVHLADVNVGIAVALDDGLVVPVLPRADALSLREVAAKTRELIAAAKAGKQQNLAAATFTISNMGMLGVDSFVAIINPPEAAILAVGSTAKRVVAGADGAIRVRDTMNVTVSADHRVLDGATAARFGNAIKSRLEDPRRLLGAAP
jgi:pyruvate dehydrogenase E2 component (dihydrolipoamide acetyltransferase)